MVDTEAVELARSLRLRDAVHYEPGGWSWTGIIVDAGVVDLILMDVEGRLCRAPRFDPGMRRIAPTPAVLRLRERALRLLRRDAVRDAVANAGLAESDAAGWDVWNLPLRELTAGETALRPTLRRYYTWPAHTRRHFEHVVAMLLEDEDAYAQYEALWKTVLGPFSAVDVARARSITPEAVRMSRMRAQRFLRRYMGEQPFLDERIQVFGA